jgi:hypothetical protein
VKTFYPQLARIIKKAIAVIEANFAVAYRFYFRPSKYQTCFQLVFNGILVCSRAVFNENIIGQFFCFRNIDRDYTGL